MNADFYATAFVIFVVVLGIIWFFRMTADTMYPYENPDKKDKK